MDNNSSAAERLTTAGGIELWNKARVNGSLQVVKGLVRRRAAEKRLFLTLVEPVGHGQ